MKIKCSICSAVQDIPEAYLGKQIKCLACNEQITAIPYESKHRNLLVIISVAAVTGIICFLIGSLLFHNSPGPVVAKNAPLNTASTETSLPATSPETANSNIHRQFNTASDTSTAPQAKDTVATQEREYDRQLLKKISTEYEQGVTDGYKQKVVFTFANNADKIFKGTITVHPLDIAGERIGMFSGETFDFQDGLGADGAQKQAVAWFENPLKIHSFDSRISGYFENAPALTAAVPFEQVSSATRPNFSEFFVYTANVDTVSLQTIVATYANRYSIIPVVEISFYNDRQNAAKQLPMDDAALNCYVGTCTIRKGIPEQIQRNPDLGKAIKSSNEKTQPTIVQVDIPEWQLNNFATLPALKQAQAKALMGKFKQASPADIANLTYEEKELIDEIPLLQTYFAPLFSAYTDSVISGKPQQSSKPKITQTTSGIKFTPEEKQQFRKLPLYEQKQAMQLIRWLKQAKPEDLSGLTDEDKKMIKDIPAVRRYAQPLMQE